MPTSKGKPKPPRRNFIPVIFTFPPDELARVRAFAAKVGRPVSWAVRDGLRVYLDAVEKDADVLARIQVSMDAAGKTPTAPLGRPSKAKAKGGPKVR